MVENNKKPQLALALLSLAQLSPSLFGNVLSLPNILSDVKNQSRYLRGNKRQTSQFS